MSFMLIRLLQRVSAITLVQEAHPASLPPPGWANSKGCNGKDKAWMRSHLTMFIQVSQRFYRLPPMLVFDIFPNGLKGGLWVRMEEAENVD